MGSVVYFASDFHLGTGDSRRREKKLIDWLDRISADATHLLLLGDQFDYWFEYKYFVPKGFVRFLGKLASMRDSGIQIEVFIGNHDIWMFDYFPDELGIPVHREPQIYEFNGKKILAGHGDGLGPGDRGYKRLKKIFHNPVLQFLYRQLHPDLSFRAARYFSRKSRAQEMSAPPFLGKEQEWLVRYSEKCIARDPEIDYCIFGHRHLPIYFPLSNQKSVYINTGDWLEHDTFACLKEESCYLYRYETGKSSFRPLLPEGDLPDDPHGLRQ